MDRFLKNARRFSGFADIYNQARPQMPVYPIEVIERYLHKKAGLIVDLGCGTGLSTAAWKNHCRSAIGIDPSGDMIAAARARQDDTLSFRQAFSSSYGPARRMRGCCDLFAVFPLDGSGTDVGGGPPYFMSGGYFCGSGL